MIVRSRRSESFSIISNQVLADDRISFRAKGILVYLLGKPDNWQVSERHLSTLGHEGVTAIRGALKELEDAGYILRQRRQAANGRFEWESVVYDEPQPASPTANEPPTADEPDQPAAPCAENLSMDEQSGEQSGAPCLGFPCVEKPCTENHAMENCAVINTIETSTEELLSSSSSRPPAPAAALPAQDQPEPPPPAPIRLPAAAVAQALGNRDPAWLAAKVAYENNIGLLTPILAQRMEEALRTYPPEWVPAAIGRAVLAEKRRWDYVEGILRNWSAEGFGGQGSGRSKPRSSTRRAQPQPAAQVAEAQPDSYADLILQ